MNKIGEKIREYRLKRGISRKVLSDGLCDESTLFRIEKGLHEPRLSTLMDICDKLAISIEQMIYTLESGDAKYIRQLKKLCREHVDQEEFDALQIVIEQVEEKIVSFNPKLTDSIIRFIHWQKAILLYRKENHLVQAKHELEKLLPYKRRLTSELDLEIAATLGKLYLHLGQTDDALEILQHAFQALRKLPSTEEKTLYVRVGYYYSKTHFYLQKYEDVIATLEDVLFHINMNKLHYMNGQIHQLLGIIFDIKGDFECAESHLNKALYFYLAEDNTYRYLKALLALARLQFKAGKKVEAIDSLNILENQSVEYSSSQEFLMQVYLLKKHIHSINT